MEISGYLIVATSALNNAINKEVLYDRATYYQNLYDTDTSTIETVTASITECENKIKNNPTEINTLNTKIKNNEPTIKNCQTKIEEAQKNLNDDTISDEQKFIIHEEMLNVIAKLEQLEIENKKYQEQVDQLTKELTDAEESLVKLTKEKTLLEYNIAYYKTKVANLNNILKAKSTTIYLDQNKLFLDGKKTSREDANEYIFRLSGRCKVMGHVPLSNVTYTTYDATQTGYDSNATPTLTTNKYSSQTYEKYADITRSIKIICDDNLDIISHEEFELIIYELDTTVPILADTLKGHSIINLIDLSDIQYGDIKKVTDTALDEISKVNLPELDWENMFKRGGGNYADIYLKPEFSIITNGYISTEETKNDTGVSSTKQVWKGDYPLDRLIYAIQNNLDILMSNQRIKGDIYGNLYATLMAQAIQSATVLEQARIQAYEQASQFQIKSMIEYYLGAINAKLSVIKTLAEVQTQFLAKAVYQSQIKLNNIQAAGFKANNINKLFTAQLEGASSAYTTGMLDIPPAIYNNSDLMSLYTNLGNNMSIL